MRTEFNRLLRHLSDARLRYEDLRIGHGHYGERAEVLSHLHDLRAAVARSRSIG